MRCVRIIGLTGGIGAGKSMVSRILRLKGYPVYDCDSEAKHLMSESVEIIDQLCNRFGEECLNLDRTINREYISRRVFNNKDELEWLNALVHSEVRHDFKLWTEHKGDICFVESAILHTSHLDEVCDEIWLVDAPENIRIKRALSRGGISLENLTQRMEVQRKEFDELEKGKIRIIKNYGDYSLLEQIAFLLISN